MSNVQGNPSFLGCKSSCVFGMSSSHPPRGSSSRSNSKADPPGGWEEDITAKTREQQYRRDGGIFVVDKVDYWISIYFDIDKGTEWEDMFNKLMAYKVNHGDCNVPQKWKPLGSWVNRQRKQYKKKQNGEKVSLSDQRVEKLEAIGFSWGKKKDVWNDRFKELKQFWSETGSSSFPTRSKENRRLGRWVTEQRRLYKLEILDENKIKKLEDIGFNWGKIRNLGREW